jgi:hypothetical protein
MNAITAGSRQQAAGNCNGYSESCLLNSNDFPAFFHKKVGFFRALFALILAAAALFASCQQEFTLDSISFEQALACGLPVVIIDINRSSITSREVWITGVPYTVYDASGQALLSGSTDIKGRGNFSWFRPKKSYSIKLSKKAPLLGMPSHKRWNLLANYDDRTNIRNELGFYLGRRLDNMAWQPRSQQVIVYLGDECVGLYQLVEAIKIDTNRVDIDEISAANTGGGYILEINNWYHDDVFKIETSRGLWLGCSDPDDDLDSIIGQMTTDVQAVEDLLYNDNLWLDAEYGWRKYFDAPSFVDFYLAAEIVKEFEINQLNGRYLYFDDESQKYCAGPLWDIDLAFGNYSRWGSEKTDGFMTIGNNLQEPDFGGARRQWWLDRMFADPSFVAEVKARWNTVQPGLNAALQAYIDERASALDAAIILDGGLWDRGQNNGLLFAALKEWVAARIEWLDGAINGL